MRCERIRPKTAVPTPMVLTFLPPFSGPPGGSVPAHQAPVAIPRFPPWLLGGSRTVESEIPTPLPLLTRHFSLDHLGLRQPAAAFRQAACCAARRRNAKEPRHSPTAPPFSRAPSQGHPQSRDHHKALMRISKHPGLDSEPPQALIPPIQNGLKSRLESDAAGGNIFL